MDLFKTQGGAGRLWDAAGAEQQCQLWRGICTPAWPRWHQISPSGGNPTWAQPGNPSQLSHVIASGIALMRHHSSVVSSLPPRIFSLAFLKVDFFPMCCSHTWFFTLTIGRQQFFYIFFKMFPGELYFNQGNWMFHYQKGFRLYQSLFVIVVMEVFIIIVKLNNGEEPVLKPLHKN